MQTRLSILLFAAILAACLLATAQPIEIADELQRRSVRVTTTFPPVLTTNVDGINIAFQSLPTNPPTTVNLVAAQSKSFPKMDPGIEQRPDEPGVVRVWFNGKRGWFYQIQGTRTLGTNWLDVTPQLVGMGRRQNFPVHAAGATMGFFRVLEAPNAPGSLQFTPSNVITKPP